MTSPDAASLLCSVSGCANRWVSDFGKRLCRRCADGDLPAKTARPLDLNTPIARPFCEPTEPDEEYVHVD